MIDVSMVVCVRVAGELGHGNDCGGYRQPGGDPERGAHGVDERTPGRSCDLIALLTELAAGVEGGTDVVAE